jgi:hypothetical protein
MSGCWLLVAGFWQQRRQMRMRAFDPAANNQQPETGFSALNKPQQSANSCCHPA